MSPAEAAHLQLLKLIERAPDFSQRELARELGVSLGKAHYLLRALVGKGWVKANNFRRNDSQSAYAYLLTPAGIGEKIRLTRDYLRRKEAEYQSIVAEIAALRSEIASAGSGDEDAPGGCCPNASTAEYHHS
jgi:EPS-associated MarR family transcriptional regulator